MKKKTMGKQEARARILYVPPRTEVYVADPYALLVGTFFGGSAGGAAFGEYFGGSAGSASFETIGSGGSAGGTSFGSAFGGGGGGAGGANVITGAKGSDFSVTFSDPWD